MKWTNLLFKVFALLVALYSSNCEAGANDDFNDNFYEANGSNKEFEVVDDLPVQDERLVRDMEKEITNMTTKSPFKSASEQEWIEEAIKDIAYYLRAHKFQEYDRRYEVNGTLAPRTYHRTYPRPPLRSLHWEVHKLCDESFLACIKYLWKHVQGSDLRRSDDTSIVIQEQHWKMDTNKEQIDAVEAECQKLKRRDDILADPFQGPLERFQWRTTATYFMCWYTMNEVEHLRHITENCDNFASCLDPKFGPRNRDYRAHDDTPFACALYSFCPDPCCEERHITNADGCWALPKSNPCHAAAPQGRRQCELNRTRNIDFTEAILNHWNVTCTCPIAGFEWDSSYGICVDIDECRLGTHTCDKQNGEACLNMPGSYKCLCKWGHTWNARTRTCTHNEAIAQIKLNALKIQSSQQDVVIERSYLRRLYKYLTKTYLNSGALLIDAGYRQRAIISLFSLVVTYMLS